MKTVINGRDVLLSESELPEFNYSISELTDFTTIRGSNSTTFKVPASKDARIALGGEGLQEQGASEVPITIGDSGTMLFKGVCRPTQWSEDSIEVTAYGDNATWFDAAKKTKCVEVDLGYTEPVTAAHVRDRWATESTPAEVSAMLKERSYFFPVIDYGSMGGYTPTTNVTLNKIRFAVSVRALLSKFFQDNGFTLRIAGSLAHMWDRLMLPSSSHSYKVKPSVSIVRASADAPEFPPNFDTPFNGINGLDIVDQQGSGFTRPSTQYPRQIVVTVDSDIAVSMVGVFTVTRAAGAENIDADINVRVYASSSNEIVAQRVIKNSQMGYVGTRDVQVDQELFTFQAQAGVFYSIFVEPRQFVPQPLMSIGIREKTRFTYSATPTGTTTDLAGAEYFVSSAVEPGMTVADLLSNLANMLRLVITTDAVSNEVTISHYDDYLLDITRGVDWRDRLDHSKLPVKVNPPQPNRYVFKFTKDEKDERAFNYNEQAVWDAEGIYETDGRDKDKVTTLKFAATQQAYMFETVIPVIKEEDKTTDYVKCKPRILMYGGPSGGFGGENSAIKITFEGVALDSFPRFYFAGQGGTDINLGYGDDLDRIGTLNRFWRTSLERAIRPYLRGDVMVYDDEVISFEFNRPRLIHDGYDEVWVYIQSVKGKTFGDEEYSRCELIPV